MWTTFLLSFNFVMKKVKQYLLSRFVVFLNYNNLSNKKWLTYDVASMIVESSWNVSCPSVLNRQQFLRVLHVMSSNGYASKMQTSKSSAFSIRGFFRIKKINCSILSIKQLSYNPRSQKTE